MYAYMHDPSVCTCIMHLYINVHTNACRLGSPSRDHADGFKLKQCTRKFTQPEIEKVVLAGIFQCRFGVVTFFSKPKTRPKRHGKTPSWTTFDFGPDKLKRNLFQQEAVTEAEEAQCRHDRVLYRHYFSSPESVMLAWTCFCIHTN
jgi:hypothetical protein